MKKWLWLLRWEYDFCFWLIFSAENQLVCRSLLGFSTEAEALADLRKCLPEDHF